MHFRQIGSKSKGMQLETTLVFERNFGLNTVVMVIFAGIADHRVLQLNEKKFKITHNF